MYRPIRVISTVVLIGYVIYRIIVNVGILWKQDWEFVSIMWSPTNIFLMVKLVVLFSVCLTKITPLLHLCGRLEIISLNTVAETLD